MHQKIYDMCVHKRVTHMLQYNVIQSFINAPCMRIYPSYSVTEISVTNNDEPESSMTNNGMYMCKYQSYLVTEISVTNYSKPELSVTHNGMYTCVSELFDNIISVINNNKPES